MSKPKKSLRDAYSEAVQALVIERDAAIANARMHAARVSSLIAERDEARADKEALAAALILICEVRDYHANEGAYPDGTVGADQCFDDWAADVASAALEGVSK